MALRCGISILDSRKGPIPGRQWGKVFPPGSFLRDGLLAAAAAAAARPGWVEASCVLQAAAGGVEGQRGPRSEGVPGAGVLTCGAPRLPAGWALGLQPRAESSSSCFLTGPACASSGTPSFYRCAQTQFTRGSTSRVPRPPPLLQSPQHRCLRPTRVCPVQPECRAARGHRLLSTRRAGGRAHVPAREPGGLGPLQIRGGSPCLPASRRMTWEMHLFSHHCRTGGPARLTHPVIHSTNAAEFQHSPRLGSRHLEYRAGQM